MRLLSLLALGLALGLAACDSADPGVSSGASADVPLAGAAAKSDICHYDADNDTYHLINVADAAIDAHIEHGDAAPGEAVPTMEGYFFDDACVSRRAVEITALSCPETLEVYATGAFAATLNDAYGPVSSSYDFGDGSTAEGTEASHAFSEAGMYDVTFTATGPFNSDTETCQVQVAQPTFDCASSGGVEVGGACWFLGARGASCTETCTGVGASYDEATLTYAGSEGTDANCIEVLDALGAPGVFLPGVANADSGVGCFLAPDTNIGTSIRTRYEAHPTSASAASFVAKRACACQ